MIRSTQIARLGDGLMLCASVDDEQSDSPLAEVKSQTKIILRRLNRNAEPQASIESGNYTIHYLISEDIVYICISERAYPRKLAFTYLAELSSEFAQTYGPQQVRSNPSLRPYAFMEFDTYMSRTKALYADARTAAAAASAANSGGGNAGLGRLNDELRDVTQVMTKNIEDLLYRGDSLERMGEMSSRLRDDSRRYRKAAVRINWDLLIKQYAPIGAFVLIVLVFVWFRFF
ncbi:snare-like protein [Durotheca rogersii]|uniref:snare-like protein n=1 Tax=Durotheca rogersii TaxID=419775 RepID=UPI00221F86B6|nr:snare-like protein [Durotheca rogersii]KAI5865546.1 snare-like protein [Durotheca rogersii]